jgi:hypothetical protein
MPDQVVAFVEGDHVRPILVIIPANGATVGHLATTAWEKDGGVEGNIVTFDGHDYSTAFVGKTIFMIEQFCFQH